MILIEIQRNEVRFFLRWLLNPVHMFRTTKNLLKTLLTRRSVRQPISISSEYTSASQKPPSPNYNPFIRLSTPNHTCGENITLPLASENYVVTAKHVDWDCYFADREDYSALHRFSWLNNTTCFFNSSDLGLKLINDWIDESSEDTSDFTYQSYNISERLINWMIFITRWKNHVSPSDKTIIKIVNSIKIQLYFLANNLEQHGKLYTNNHLFNNGRSLYMVGMFIQENDLVDLGRECIRFACNNLFSEEGFLKEHSSHYHLLIVKNFIEVFSTAHAFDPKFEQEIKETITKLLVASQVFIGKHKNSAIPFIGDISPDVSPAWLANIFSVIKKNRRENNENEESTDISWFSSWNISKTGIDDILDNHTPENIHKICDRESGFFCFSKKSIRFYFHNPISQSKPNFSHYHADDLSFTVMIDDTPIIQDPGRSTYIGSHMLSQYAKSPYGHNTVFYNKKAISPAQCKLFPKEYTQANITIDETGKSAELKLRVQHPGFKRFDKNISFQRKFHVCDSSFLVSDFWKLPSKQTITTRFHLSSSIHKVVKNNNKLTLILEEHKIVTLFFTFDNLVKIDISRAVLGINPEQCRGWSFPQYGKAIPAYTIDFHQEISGEFENKLTVQVPGGVL